MPIDYMWAIQILTVIFDRDIMLIYVLTRL